MRSRFAVPMIAAVVVAASLTPVRLSAAAATTPLFSITPTAFDFGSQPLHSPSAEQIVTVTNVSGGPQTMNGTGGGGGLFGGVQDCQGETLQPGDSCQMFYAFTPDKLGEATGSASGSWNGQRYMFHFRGIGTPQFAITPAGFDFGHVPVGSASSEQTVTVTNLGTTAATMNGTGGGAGVFGGVQSCQGLAVQPADSCQMSYRFTPISVGDAFVRAKGTWNGQHYTFRLHGVGTGPAAYDFVPLAPFRADSGSAPADTKRAIKVTGGDVPHDARAVDLSVTVRKESGTGAVTIWPCGSRMPKFATIRFRKGRAVSNHVDAQVGSHGKVCLRAGKKIDFTFDLDGYYPAASGFQPLPPHRKLDSHKAGKLAANSTTRVKVLGGTVPSSVAAVALNVTALDEARDGRLAVWPCGQPRPHASALSYQKSQPRSAFVTAKVGKDGKVCVWTKQRTDVVVDVVGYHAANTTIRTIAAHQVSDRGLVAGKTATVKVTGGGTGIAADARAAIIEITASAADKSGSLALYPCGITAPPTTVLSYHRSSAVSNVGISYLGDGRVCIKTSQHVHIDVAAIGWYRDNDVT